MREFNIRSLFQTTQVAHAGPRTRNVSLAPAFFPAICEEYLYFVWPGGLNRDHTLPIIRAIQQNRSIILCKCFVISEYELWLVGK